MGTIITIATGIRRKAVRQLLTDCPKPVYGYIRALRHARTKDDVFDAAMALADGLETGRVRDEITADALIRTIDMARGLAADIHYGRL